MKKDCWRIEVLEKRSYKVSFEEEVTSQEAKDIFNEGIDFDILDEECVDILEIEESS